MDSVNGGVATMIKCLAIAMAISGCIFDGATDEGDDAGEVVPDAAACGNGELDADEACDDGNQLNQDGCDAACEHEPAFECAAAGGPCKRVTGIEWNVSTSSGPDTLGGSPGGEFFEDNCRSDEVVVGFLAGLARGCDGGPGGMVRVTPICAPISFDDLGVASRGQPRSLAEHGECNPFDDLEISWIECPQGTVVSEMRGGPGEDGSLAGGRLECSVVSHRGDLTVRHFGLTEDQVGDAPFEQRAECAPGEVAVGISGHAGQRLNRVSLRCSTIEAVVGSAGE